MDFVRRMAVVLGVVLLSVGVAQAETKYSPLLGSNLIEGYNYGKDVGPKGRILFDSEKQQFIGAYKGLKMPKGQKAVFAWLHDTVNQKSTYLGPVGWLGKNGRSEFAIALPKQFAKGNWGSNEIIGFTAEKTGLIKKGNKVSKAPASPAGTESIQPPAFYLFAALPGVKTEEHYCGHGQDFFYANAPEKQVCYDCICGQPYSACIEAGLPS